MKQKNFTLLELLMVCAIIGILLTLLLPSLFRARELSKRAVCLSNLAQVYRGLAQFSSSNDSQLPAAQAVIKNGDGNYGIKSSRNVYGHGYLYSTGMVTDPYLGQCPSSTNKVHGIGGEDGFQDSDTSTQEQMAKKKAHICTSYAYRSTFAIEGSRRKWAFRGPSFLLDDPGRLLMSDHFTLNYSVKFTHKQGHNGTFIDGSAKWDGNKGLLYLGLGNSHKRNYQKHEDLFWQTRDR